MNTNTQTRTPGFDKKLLLGAMLAAGLALGAGGAQAATEPGTLTVTASVLQTCAISDGRLSFGEYTTGQGTNLDAISVGVKVDCTTGTVYQVYSTTATRHMVSGVNTLNFQLYSDSGRTVVLPTTNISGALAGVGTGDVGGNEIYIYGRMASGQTAAAGNYTLPANLTIFY